MGGVGSDDVILANNALWLRVAKLCAGDFIQEVAFLRRAVKIPRSELTSRLMQTEIYTFIDIVN